MRGHGNTLSWKLTTQRRTLVRATYWQNAKEFVWESSRKHCTNEKVTIYFSTVWDALWDADDCPWWWTRKRDAVDGASWRWRRWISGLLRCCNVLWVQTTIKIPPPCKTIIPTIKMYVSLTLRADMTSVCTCIDLKWHIAWLSVYTCWKKLWTEFLLWKPEKSLAIMHLFVCVLMLRRKLTFRRWP